MSDATFDAVIVGGGNKALLLAMYLIKYGGMSVAIFERRHEIGGCLATEEISAPGFRGNTHATIVVPFYYGPHYRDFPEFWEYGAQCDQYLVSEGAVFKNNNTCLAIYSEKHDPTQERTAREITRFSSRDAEQWLKFWKLWQSDELQRVVQEGLFNPPEMRVAPEMLERQMALLPNLVEADFEPDSLRMSASYLRCARDLFESKELQYCIMRYVLQQRDVSETGVGVEMFSWTGSLPILSFVRGGTHQIAHAAHKILVRDGCKFFTHCEVDKVIIENGAAKGIRLADGSRIAARKLVVSTLNPAQLCFDLIGREHLDYRTVRRVEALESTFLCLMWYSFALREAPKYEAAAFNPDINETFWLGMAEDADPEHIARECHYQKLRRFPPLEDYCPAIWCHSLVDPSYAPAGMHIAQSEQLGPPAPTYTEREWLEIKKRYGEELISIWKRHAPNMNEDNIIGVDSNSPYDCLRQTNCGPNGNMAILDCPPYQRDANRPTPELANHRTPIKNLYGTGSGWSPGGWAASAESYNCYKIIAGDLGLGKPWEEPGKEEPDSLVEQQKITKKNMREAFPTTGDNSGKLSQRNP
jgi:beta-carotene ketolase (CrtO type)